MKELRITPCDTCYVLHFQLHPEMCMHVHAPPQTRQLLCDQPDKNCSSCHGPSPITLTLVPETLEWCIEKKGKYHVGISNCEFTYSLKEEPTDRPWKTMPLECLLGIPDENSDHLTRKLNQCSITLLKRMY